MPKGSEERRSIALPLFHAQQKKTTLTPSLGIEPRPAGFSHRRRQFHRWTSAPSSTNLPYRPTEKNLLIDQPATTTANRSSGSRPLQWLFGPLPSCFRYVRSVMNCCGAVCCIETDFSVEELVTVRRWILSRGVLVWH